MKMTISLLGAIEWYRNCPPSWKDRALDAVKNTLTQQFTGTTATARGDKYEEKVNRVLAQGREFEGVQKPLNALRGMRQQAWLKGLSIELPNKPRINGLGKTLTFTFRGRMDYIGSPEKELMKGWAGQKVICDLKTTGSTIKAAKYTDSLQHIVYCLSEGIPRFAYFVAQFATDSSLDPVDLQMFPFDLSDEMDEGLGRIREQTAQAVEFLVDFNLWKPYYEIFNGGKP